MAITSAAAAESRERGELVHRPVICLSSHWECPLVPETRSAFRHFAPALGGLVKAFPGMIGHAHPRIFKRLAPIYEQAGIEPVASFDEVLARASVYLSDNSSTLYEFGSTGRPVLCLNAPWYRRDIEHGLRFWSHVPGLQCDEPTELVASVSEALADPEHARHIRARAVARVYASVDGQASQRAADAIRKVLATAPDGGRVTRSGRR